jgi:hypothetical protein
MKSLLFTFTVATCLLYSCTKDSQNDSAYTGQTMMLDCFSRIGIQTVKGGNQDSLIIIIPDNLPSEYNAVGKTLEFNAEIRSNTLTPNFPDPSIDASTLYQGKVSNVREKTQ